MSIFGKWVLIYVLVCVLVSMNVLCIVVTFLNVKKLDHVPILNAAF